MRSLLFLLLISMLSGCTLSITSTSGTINNPIDNNKPQKHKKEYVKPQGFFEKRDPISDFLEKDTSEKEEQTNDDAESD